MQSYIKLCVVMCSYHKMTGWSLGLVLFKSYQSLIYTSIISMPYKHKNIITKKERNRQLILAHLSNPENDFPSREALATKVLGYKDGSTLYVHFSPAELSLIEAEALQVRRTKYAPALSRVDRGILQKGASGDPGAAKLCYQRFEDWSEKQRIEGKVTFEAVLNQLAGSQSQDMKDITPRPDSPEQGDMITDIQAPGRDDT